MLNSLFRNLKFPRSCQEVARRGVSVSKLETHWLDMGADRKIAYHKIPGSQQPTIVMVPGMHSYTQMNGNKSSCLLRYCDMNSFPCVVFDNECTGKSVGDPVKLTFTTWVENTLGVIDSLTDGPVVLVGTCLGGWLSLIAAKRIPERLHGLVLFSPAINYVMSHYNRHKATLPPDVKARLEAGDIHVHTHEFGDYMLKKDFAEDSLQYEIDLKKDLDIRCPVRIIHGLNDEEVDPNQSLSLGKALQSPDVDLIFRKNSGHIVHEPHDLELFLVTLDRMLKDNPVRRP